MKRTILKTLVFTLFTIFTLFTHRLVPVAQAREGQVLGIHILNPSELDSAKQLVAVDDKADTWYYVTIPFSLEDVGRTDQWQDFFNKAKEKRVIPLVRLVTKYDPERNAWAVPNRKEVVSQINALAALEWPTDKKNIIIFNEVNHAKEWGGTLDPAGYVEIFRFASQWAHAVDSQFVVMPAAMDLAAPNGSVTKEAFTYLDEMLAYDPTIFEYADVWNSHSYPNPGFSSSPQRTGKNSLRGFEYELAYLKEKTGKDFQVMITETGWVMNTANTRWLESYYTYALEHIWSNPQVIAVTPFVLSGDPGPFSNFTFLNREGKPTRHYTALQNALKKVYIN
jgi:hypothetical protein